MPRVTAKGKVTIPKRVREALGIEPGDEVTFERTDSGYTLQKNAPTTADGDDPFEKYRGRAESDDTMPDRMRKLRGEYPRNGSDSSSQLTHP